VFLFYQKMYFSLFRFLLKIKYKYLFLVFLFFSASFLFFTNYFKKRPLCSSYPAFPSPFQSFFPAVQLKKGKIILQKCFKKCCSWSKFFFKGKYINFTFFNEIIYIKILIFLYGKLPKKSEAIY
jgi:hypothetical protein